VADGAWSYSTCRPDVQWYGVPGQGSHLYTVRFGQYWVGGGVYQAFAAARWECGALGPPVKAYQWLTEFGAYGQWFEGGAIFYRSGRWQVVYGNYGQTAGRLTEAPEVEAPADAELPPDPPTSPAEVPKAPAE
jgi:hypothetical protein